MEYLDFFGYLLETAADDAHKKGLKSGGFGRWEDSSGKTVARTVDGKLVNTNSPEISKSKTQNTKVTADVVLAKKVDMGIKPGMNEGGTYKGTDGKVRYVKFYKNPIVAHDEKLCNDFYSHVGLKAPSSDVFQKSGKTIFSSDLLTGIKGEVLKFIDKKTGLIPKSIANKILEGFVADCFMANWDAVGVNEGYMRNILVMDDGSVARIDQGGSLLTGGLGNAKPDVALNNLAEWKYFPTQNPSYSKVFESAGITKPEQIPSIHKQIENVLSLGKKSGGWNKYVTDNAPSMPKESQTRIGQMLESRAKILEKK